MKNLKKVLIGIGIVVILSQPVLADTCYDPYPDLKGINEKTVTTIPTTHNLQGWDQQWENPDINNKAMIKDNALNATNMVFRQVSYSPETGLRCVYHVTDGPSYLLGNNQLIAANSQQPISGSFVRMVDAGNLDLTKHVSINLDSIKSSSLWHSSPDSPNTFVCMSDFVQACAFTTR